MHGYQHKSQKQGFGPTRGRNGSPPHRNAPAVKSRLANALTKISQEVDLDLMESAFAISSDAIREIISGRNPASERTYSAHIEHRIAHTPVLSRWFATPDAPYTKELTKQLKYLASTSQRRAGLRRNNFTQLSKAFSDDITVLADALQLAESGVLRIISGELEFDDQRFGHINPLLVAAGFEDGWLELADPSLSDSMIQRLRQLAKEGFDDHTEVGVATETHVIAAKMPEIEQTSGSDNSGVLVANSESDANTTNTAPIAATQTKETDMTKPASAKTSTAPAAPKTTAARTSLLSRGALSAGRSILSGASGSSTKPIPAAAGLLAAASAPAAGPTVTHRVTRSVPAAAPTPAPATPASAQSAASAVAAGKSLQPVVPGKTVKAVKPGKKAATASKPQSKGAPKPAVNASTTTGAAATANTSVPKGKPSDSKEKQISLARAAALQSLLEQARRKAKVTLWRDLMNSSLPVWGNIRNGQVLLRDDKANQITKHLGLPDGWLDNPVMPPPTIAAWVMDPTVPLPTAAAPKQQGLDLAPSEDKAPAPATAASSNKDAAPSPAAAKSPAPAAGGLTLDWKPAAQAQAVQSVGPVGTALLSVVEGLMKDGQLTEADALTMLNYFMANKK
ncbi:hypothetical protein [Comamonas thiooxydans]|uniref:hypothetical protein n=1 Tax=Comamonas thiooxydans TaxID=363952 RepID=UPI001186D9EE|nr:hypothetical protein [Comamonas thiooxydans]